MKRITCTLAALAMLIWTCTPAQAEFLGTLQGNQPWTLEVDNASNGSAAAMTIFYLGGKNVDFDIHTLAAGEAVTFTDLKIPRGTRRIIIELDPGFPYNQIGSIFIPVRVFQGSSALAFPAGGYTWRLVFDVV